MGKVTYEGFEKYVYKGIRKDVSDVPVPTGPITKRDGTKVITLTIIEEKPK